MGEHTVMATSGWEAPPGADPFTHWVSGHAVMGDTPFSMPIITHVEGNLYQGGWVLGIDLGDRFQHILSLYPWHQYPIADGVERREVEMYDSHDGPDRVQVVELADWAIDRAERGAVLIHCQAGLNRSALIAAMVLVRMGRAPSDAIALLRERRSPAVLCNPTFEQWLIDEA
jgi:protein-tyrosine phosphatase